MSNVHEFKSSEDMDDEEFVGEFEAAIAAQNAAEIDSYELTHEQEPEQEEPEQAESDDTGPTKQALLKAQNRRDMEVLSRDIHNRLQSVKNTRKQANDDIKSILSDAETKGFNREAIKLGAKILEWDRTKLDAFFGSLQIFLDAHGINIQQDLFPARSVADNQD